MVRLQGCCCCCYCCWLVVGLSHHHAFLACLLLTLRPPPPSPHCLLTESVRHADDLACFVEEHRFPPITWRLITNTFAYANEPLMSHWLAGRVCVRAVRQCTTVALTAVAHNHALWFCTRLAKHAACEKKSVKIDGCVLCFFYVWLLLLLVDVGLHAAAARRRLQ